MTSPPKLEGEIAEEDKIDSSDSSDKGEEDDQN